MHPAVDLGQCKLATRLGVTSTAAIYPGPSLRRTEKTLTFLTPALSWTPRGDPGQNVLVVICPVKTQSSCTQYNVHVSPEAGAQSCPEASLQLHGPYELGSR